MDGYINNGKVQDNLKENNAFFLINGYAFKEILTNNHKLNYFHDHISVIGSSLLKYNYIIPPKLKKRF